MIALTGNVDGFFQEVVGDAMRSRRIEASPAATTYLVALLTDYTHPAREQEHLNRPLTLQLDEALQLGVPAERFERLRSLGDTVLYAAGFFGEHFEARGVDARYVHGIGTRAYGTAASMLRSGSSSRSVQDQAVQIDVFGELASKFAGFVAVIEEIADITLTKSAAGPKGLLKLYERWQKTGSERLAQSLSEQGLVPMRGPKGVQ
ncbi:MAG TPA: hypothetical protein VF316_12050 [Polyangiaceae bacterium]